MDDTSLTKEEQLRNHIIIDGVAGHLFPITEAEKLAGIHDSSGEEIPQIPSEVITSGNLPQFFDVRLPDREIRTYEVLKSEVNTKNGFKALAYREVDAVQHLPVRDEQGKYQLRMSFQGFVKGKGDTVTAAKIFAGIPVAHIAAVENFTKGAIEAAGGKDQISALVSGSHSYGAINALESYRVAKEVGVEQVDVVLLETYGARSALENLANRLAEKELQGEGGGQSHASKAKKSDIARGIYSEIAQHVTSINSSPSSLVTGFPFRKSPADPVGAVHAQAVDEVKHIDKKGKEKEPSAIGRHLLGTMMQAAYSGVLPQFIEYRMEMGKRRSR